MSTTRPHDSHHATQESLLVMTRIVAQLDLEQFLRYSEMVAARGPIVDPGLFRDAAADYWRVPEIAKAALEFQRALKRSGVLRRGGDAA